VAERLHLKLKSSLCEVERLTSRFHDFAQEQSLSPQVRCAVDLVLEEVVLNVIKHGCGGRDDQSLTVEIGVEGDELIVSFEDSCPAFDPLQHPPPDVSIPLEQRGVGGLGIHLLRQVMDRVNYSRVEGKNRLVLAKRLQGTC
jgi:anti-sigma regulatory factor (Ser/Thr protein kinase)